MKNGNKTLLKALIFSAGAAAAAYTGKNIYSMSGGIVDQMKVMNMLLTVFCLMAAGMIVLNILGGISLPRIKISLPERKKKSEPGTAEPQHMAPVLYDYELDMDSDETNGTLSCGTEELRQEPVNTNYTAGTVTENAAYEEKDYLGGNMAGYGVISNKDELMFNLPPHIRAVKTKSTFSIYRKGNTYTLEPSKHWISKTITVQDIKNEMFKYIFSVQASSQSSEYVMRQNCRPAVLRLTEEGDFVVDKKGTIYLESV